VLRVVLRGAPTDPQFGGYRGIGEASRHELGHLGLARCKAEPRTQLFPAQRRARHALHVDHHGAALCIRYIRPEQHRMQPIPRPNGSHLAASGERPRGGPGRSTSPAPMGHPVSQRYDRALQSPAAPRRLARQAALQAHRLVHRTIGGGDEHRTTERIEQLQLVVRDSRECGRGHGRLRGYHSPVEADRYG
jgi:hypothetical protein